MVHACIIPDDKREIVETVLRLKERVGPDGFVFTSGGIGPTHDDITYEVRPLAGRCWLALADAPSIPRLTLVVPVCLLMITSLPQAIAAAFGAELELHQPTVERMEEHYRQRGVELNEARLRMAKLPTDGAPAGQAASSRAWWAFIATIPLHLCLSCFRASSTLQRVWSICLHRDCGSRWWRSSRLTSCQASRASSSKWWRRTRGGSRALQHTPACCTQTWGKVGRATAGSAGHSGLGTPQLFAATTNRSYRLLMPRAGDLAIKLGSVAAMHPAVRVGSYPNVAWESDASKTPWRVRPLAAPHPLAGCGVACNICPSLPHQPWPHLMPCCRAAAAAGQAAV